MNPQKALIVEGERHKKEKEGILDLISKASDIESKIDVMLLIMGNKIREEVATIDARLGKLQKEFVQSFEAESTEVNQKLGGALMMASQLSGKEPLAITGKISELAETLKTTEDQEIRNDAFYEMMAHVNALKKR